MSSGMCSFLCPCDIEKIPESVREEWLKVKYNKALRMKYDRCIQGPVDLEDIDLQEALLKLKDKVNSRNEDNSDGQLSRRLQRGRDTAREVVKEKVEEKIKDKIEDKIN